NITAVNINGRGHDHCLVKHKDKKGSSRVNYDHKSGEMEEMRADDSMMLGAVMC
ncbi:hypothetical protein WUBG_12583, partial [Wuchereria bancrofti]